MRAQFDEAVRRRDVRAHCARLRSEARVEAGTFDDLLEEVDEFHLAFDRSHSDAAEGRCTVRNGEASPEAVEPDGRAAKSGRDRSFTALRPGHLSPAYARSTNRIWSRANDCTPDGRCYASADRLTPSARSSGDRKPHL